MRRGLRPSDQGAKLARAVADAQGSVHTAPNQALEPIAYSFGSATLRLPSGGGSPPALTCWRKMEPYETKAFIGSSTEALKTAYAVQENLEHDVLCTVWTQGIFQLSGNALDNLLDAVHGYDFAVFVFQLDDISQIRDVRVRTVRDNIVFELGMFIAVLGKEKVFFLVPKGSEDIHLPTDL